MIPETVKKIKLWYEDNKNDLFIAVVIFLVGMAGSGLGRLSVLWIPKEPVVITGPEAGDNKANFKSENPVAETKEASIIGSAKGQFVASKSGTAYHLPWCPGAQKIKEENKIWFQSKEEAESRGYKPAGNCAGL